MRIKQVFVSNDGKEFDSKTDCIKYEGKHICPKCNGDGVLQEKYNAYPANLPDSGWVDDWKYRSVDCDLCKGAGYTEKQLKPITKVVGYE